MPGVLRRRPFKHQSILGEATSAVSRERAKAVPKVPLAGGPPTAIDTEVLRVRESGRHNKGRGS